MVWSRCPVSYTHAPIVGLVAISREFRLNRPRLLSARLTLRSDGIEEAKELLDMRNMKGIVNTFTHANKGKITPAVLAADVGTYQRADASGIDIGTSAKSIINVWD